MIRAFCPMFLLFAIMGCHSADPLQEGREQTTRDEAAADRARGSTSKSGNVIASDIPNVESSVRPPPNVDVAVAPRVSGYASNRERVDYDGFPKQIDVADAEAFLGTQPVYGQACTTQGFINLYHGRILTPWHALPVSRLDAEYRVTPQASAGTYRLTGLTFDEHVFFRRNAQVDRHLTRVPIEPEE